MDHKTQIRFSAYTAIISVLFIILISVLLLVNFGRVTTSGTVDSETIEAISERVSSDPDNEILLDDIRNLDLLARKAFISTQYELRIWGYMLVVFIIIAFISLYIYSTKSEPDNNSGLPHHSKIYGLISHKAYLIASGGLTLLAFISIALSYNDLRVFEGGSVDLVTVQDIENEGISNTAAVSLLNTDDLSESPQTDADRITVSLPGRDEILQNHNNFRGPFGNGIVYHKDLPVEWDASTNSNIKWKITLQKKGNNSPVIWGDRLFISGAEEDDLTIYCYDITSGKLLWQKDVNNIPGSLSTLPKVTEDTGLAAPSLTTDGQRVYGIFATGDIICFDMDGNRLWARNLGLPENHYGHSSSLLCWQDKVFVQYDTNKGGKLIALDVFTGETVWQTIRNTKISWASPILALSNGAYQLILAADPNVAGYDPETGRELWSKEGITGEVGPSPAYSDGIVYTVNEYSKIMAYSPVTGRVLWENNEFLPDVSSPVASQGLLFIATSYAVFVCYDALTGEKYWDHQAKQGFMSSPVIAEGKVYVTDWDGWTYVFELSKTKNLIANPSVGEAVFTTPAFSAGNIFIRGRENLFCIGK